MNIGLNKKPGGVKGRNNIYGGSSWKILVWGRGELMECLLV